VNGVLVVLALVVVAGAAVVPLLAVLVPLLALPASVLTRLAVEAARDAAPARGIVRAEFGRLAWRKIGLATVQLLVLGLGVLNVSLAPAIGGLPGLVAGVVAAYALVASSVYAVALWPIVCDPRREGPLAQQLRLALAVTLLRPLQLGVLALLAVLAGIVSAQLVVPALFLPSLVVLAAAAYVVDLADRLRFAGDSAGE
jgi:hypothetical protein